MSHRDLGLVQSGTADVVDPQRRMLLKAGFGAAAATTLNALAPAFAATPEPAKKDYKVVWSPDRLDALRKQVKSFRFPRLIPGSGWTYGMDPDYLRALVAYWADGFDMEGAARDLNRFPQYITRVEDIDIHFIRVIGEGSSKARLPLLSTHGWPGSVYEFWQAIEPLAFPSRFGGKPEDAFDLIIPTLPGYGSSGKPLKPIGVRTTARLWDKLMRENLGYESYYAQGGDWGSGVTGWLAIDYPEHVKAIHLNLMIVAPQVLAVTEAEKKFYEDTNAAELSVGAYYHLQATEPQSLAYAMTNNPVAQAAWIIERFYAWADKRTRPFDKVYTMDQMLTNVMIYVMNDALQTSTWFYAGGQEEHVRQIPKGVRVAVPTGYAAYTGDGRSPNPPRSIVEQGYNLQYWAEVPHGGHFAAMEVPDLYVHDMRNWKAALKL